MTSICLYFQVHQPFRLRNYTFYQIGHDHHYEAVDVNYDILNRIADQCYLPTNALMLELIEKWEGRFKIAYSISGTCLEQLQLYRPDVVASFQKLAQTGCVEFLAETYYHSLSALFHPEEFARQVKKHADKIEYLFGQKPTSFRNTELIYDDRVAQLASSLGFDTILAEGVDRYLAHRPATWLYQSASQPAMNVLLRQAALSDDIAFRFSDPKWSEYPLLAPRYASWLQGMKDYSQVILLGMDYETFGEHRKAETGIFQFMSYLPGSVLADEDLRFALPAEIKSQYKATEVYAVPHPTSWADADRDISAWLDNHMQADALRKVYQLTGAATQLKDPRQVDAWSKLQTSDHFYYMNTRYWNDGVRQAFSPYKSPYDAYINYMNVISDFAEWVKQTAHLPELDLTEVPDKAEVLAPKLEKPKKVKAPAQKVEPIEKKTASPKKKASPSTEKATKAPAKKAKASSQKGKAEGQ